MTKTFHLTIAKVGEQLFNGEVHSVTLPGLMGQFTVLANHEPYVCELKAGEARIQTEEKDEIRIQLTHIGIAEVSKNQATIVL